MILVDTSVWIDHWKAADHRLSDLLFEEQVLSHPFVVGELACGKFKHRSEILTLMKNLGHAPVVAHDDVLTFVEAHALMGSGLGWIDVHLLASASRVGERLWTRDNRLARAARRLGVSFTP